MRTYSFFYDYPQASSPYQNSSKVRRSHVKKVFTAQERKNPLLSIAVKKKSKSFGNLSRNIRKDVKSAGDFNDVSEEILENKNLKSMTAHVATRVSVHNRCSNLVSRRSSGNQRMLRYLLKLSNNTFHATLQHEIDVLKKEKEKLENESTLHAHSILKILKHQFDEKRVMMALIEQNQKLEHDIQRKESLLEALSEDIRELKLKSLQPIFLTYVNHETIFQNPSDTTMKYDTRTKKSHQKPSKSHPLISTQTSLSSNSKIQSKSAPILNPKVQAAQLSKTSIDSDLNCKLPITNSDYLTDTEILNKNISFQKNAATNYSMNDCLSSLLSSSSKKRIKSRTWTKFLCCR